MKVQNPREMGAVVRQARTASGMSQAELAKLVGVHQPKISEIEQGRSGVGIGLILRVVNALGLSLDVRSRSSKEHVIQGTTKDELDALDAVANTGLRK